jgi:hypothetical protein
MTKQIRVVGVYILASCMVGAAGAPSAFAAEAPHWLVEGAALKAGESRNVVGKNAGTFKMTTSSETISCNKDAASGAIEGGSEGGSATSKTTYTECVVEKKPECHVNSVGEPEGTIASESADGELVFLRKEGEEGKGPLGEYITSPTTGSKAFAEIEQEGSECSVKGVVKPTGSVIAEVSPVDEEVEVGRLIFPATSILHAYRWESSGGVKEIVADLEVGGAHGGIHGEEELELESKEKYGAFG